MSRKLAFVLWVLLWSCGCAHAQLFTSLPGNPAPTSSTTQVMAGIGGVCQFTTVTVGPYWITVYGVAANSVAGNGVLVQLGYGAGAPPGNGAATTGSLLGNAQLVTSPNASQFEPFSLTGYLILPASTQIWVDLRQSVVGSGVATLANVVCQASAP